MSEVSMNLLSIHVTIKLLFSTKYAIHNASAQS